MTQAVTKYVKQCEYCQIGPWKVAINHFEYSFRALICIDSVISLPEVIPVDNATSKTVAKVFENSWLSRYPFPNRWLHDNNNAFLGPEFLQMLKKNDIYSIPTTVKNLQVNAIVEHMHQIVRCFIISDKKKYDSTVCNKINHRFYS